jgi:putative transposase
MPEVSMTVILAHWIRMYPNNIEAAYLLKACGVARFAYNWALAEWRRLYAQGKKVSEGDLQ